MREGKSVIVDCLFAKKHIPAVDDDKFLGRYFGYGHISHQLRDTPVALNCAYTPIDINQHQ